MPYSLQIDNAAYRVFRKLPKDVQDVVIKHAEILKTDPMAGQPLQGKHRFLRSLHLGYKGTAYRIIYQVVAKNSVVYIRLVGSRENIYQRLKDMNVKSLKN